MFNSAQRQNCVTFLNSKQTDLECLGYRAFKIEKVEVNDKPRWAVIAYRNF